MTETEAIRQNYELGVIAGEAREQQRIIALLEEFIENSDLPEVVDRLEWLKDSIEGENK
jgi:hypothetical protein